MKLKYNDNQIFYDLNEYYFQESLDRVLLFDFFVINNSGFKIYEEDQQTIIADFSSYKNLYAETSNAIQYSRAQEKYQYVPQQVQDTQQDCLTDDDRDQMLAELLYEVSLLQLGITEE